MSDKEKQKYADEWNESAKFFYENKDYSWMCNCINGYGTVLEVGCGTGQSTLALLENGHKVIAIEKNNYCIDIAQQLVTSKGYTYDTSLNKVDEVDVVFINGDISDRVFISKIPKNSFDIIICWNVGSCWSREMIEFYTPKLVEYGLSIEQILDNPESSYSEYIIWLTCKIGNEFCKSVHLIERLGRELDSDDRNYYDSLREEFLFRQVKYDSKETYSISKGGRILSVDQRQYRDERLKLILFSIVYEV